MPPVVDHVKKHAGKYAVGATAVLINAGHLGEASYFLKEALQYGGELLKAVSGAMHHTAIFIPKIDLTAIVWIMFR